MSIFGQRKHDTRSFQRSFQSKPVLETFAPSNDHRGIKSTSIASKNSNLFKKGLEDRRPKNIFELNKHSYPKSVLAINSSKPNFCTKKQERNAKTDKPCPKIIETDDQPCDEEAYDKPASVINHRFSDIYKPSKFLENRNKGHNEQILETTARIYQSGTSSHTRTKSLTEAPNVNNYNAAKCTYTEECRDEPIYMLTEGFETLLKDREYEDFYNMLERATFDEEKKWEFQKQYKLQKSYVERKEGDFGAPSEHASSSKKHCISLQNQTAIHQVGPASLSKKRLDIDSTVKNLTTLLSPLNKNSGSKLDGSMALTMSSTSEGIMYRSAYMNMVNFNNRNFKKLLLHKGSLVEFGATKKANIKLKPQTGNKNQIFERESKKSQFQSKKESVIEDGRQRGLEISESGTSKGDQASSKLEINFQTDLSIFGREEAFNGGAILDHSHINKSNTGLLGNTLALYCDEQLDIPSGIALKNSYADEDEQIKVVPKKLSFEPSTTDIKDTPLLENVSREEELRAWIKSMKSNDISGEIYENMLLNEYTCQPDAYYFSTKQTQVTPLMRAILLDWMAEVSEEFCMKRGTFYTAINYVDRFMSVAANIQKDQLQLLGTTALFIAFKMDETESVRMKNFTKATDDAYTVEQLKGMELQICKALRWRLQSNTLFTWANWYMRQWDLFLELVYSSKLPCLANNHNKSPIFFKQADNQSYSIFREAMQILDLLMLDVETLKYNQRALVASVLYLIIGKYYDQFNQRLIVTEFSTSGVFMAYEFEEFNTFFSEFLREAFGFEVQDLFPTIQYVSSYFLVKISVEMPLATKKLTKNILMGHCEEFFCYQTHSSENLPVAKTMIRKR